MSSQNSFDELVLYKSPWCGYCARVLDFSEHQGMNLRVRDILSDPDARSELIDGGGRSTVPCLRITESNGEVWWMYESMDIIDYLSARMNQS